MDFSTILNQLPLFIEGVVETLKMVPLALSGGFIVATLFATLKTSSSLKFLIKLIDLFCFVFRGSPLIVQLFAFYYGIGGLEWVQNNSLLWVVFKNASHVATLVLFLNTSAYTTNILISALRKVEVGLVEAAKSLGLNFLQTLFYIRLPLAYRYALNDYSNEVIFTLQGSALASAITVQEITGVGGLISSNYFIPFEAYLTVGLIYFAMTYFLVASFRALEKRMKVSFVH